MDRNSNPAGPTTDKLLVFLCGDVMTGRGIDQILPHPVDPELHESYVKDARDYVRLAERANGPVARPVDADYVWGEALHVWQLLRPDLRVINLETSITCSDDFWPTKGIHYRMHPRNTSCLDAAHIDCAVLANNHVLDWGYAGLTETLLALQQHGIAMTGAGETLADAERPARFDIVGKGRVLVFGFADSSCGVPPSWQASAERPGVNRLPDLSGKTAQRTARFIRDNSKPGDTVVASIHWGGNWGYDVSSEQRAFARYLVDHAGVAVVHGHSSHHPIGIEVYRGRVILYGCGDFLNDYEGIAGHEHYRPWLALMYFAAIDTRSQCIDSLEIVPLQLKRLQLIAASDEDRQWLLERLNATSKPCSTQFQIVGDHLCLA